MLNVIIEDASYLNTVGIVPSAIESDVIKTLPNQLFLKSIKTYNRYSLLHYVKEL